MGQQSLGLVYLLPPYPAMTIGSLFSGVGGFELAFQRAGFSTAYSVEIDKHCRKLLASKDFGGVIHDDVTTFDPDPQPCPNIITFGSPCQDLSVAGQRAGLAGARSGLFFYATRIIKRLVRRGLEFALWENVPGCLSSNGGRDFASVLAALADCGALDISWRVLDAQWFGLAQRRKRVFLVADFRGHRAYQILSLRESLQEHPAPSRETQQRVAPTIEGRAGRSGANNFATGLIEPELTHALRSEGADASEDGTWRGTPLVCANPIGAHHGRNDLDHDTYILAHGQANAEVVRDGSPSLTCNHEAPIAVTPIQSVNMVCEKKQNGIGIGKPGDAMFTVTGRDQHAIAFSSKDSGNDAGELAPTLRAQNFKDSHMNGGGQVAIAFQESQSGCREYADAGTLRANGPGHDPVGTRIRHGHMVRRLTPQECEKLMGFPVGWTEGFSDSVRYKMLGNSVAVPVVHWISKRISDAIISFNQ